MSPLIKFEVSPSESSIDHFDSSSPTAYPPLFGSMDSLNPDDLDGSEYDYGDYEGFENVSNSASTPSSGTPQPQEKKMVKKRKSWGQQLPEPKTNLPPRKRAKTEDEKEQRRVERVLRNRRAAQSSRERKRQEVEALEAEKLAIERKNRDLEMRLAEAEARNLALEQQLVELSNSSSPYSHQSSPVQPKQQSSPRQVTLSQPLFSTSESNSFRSSDMDHLNLQSSLQPQTVNPASLSPETRPAAEASNASSSDMTQHSAAVLWDLQCQSEEQRPWMASNPASPSTLLLLLSLISTTTLAILSPLSRIISSSRTRSCPSPAASSFNTIIWLLTTTPTTPPTPLAASTSTSTTSSSAAEAARTRPWTRPRFGLRRGVLRRLLACSPHLARPLMDATVSAMRLASEQPIPSMSGDAVSLADTRAPAPASAEEVSVGGVVPVKVLAALLWATHVIERDYQRRASLAADVDAATRRHRGGRSGLLAGKGESWAGLSL